MSSAIKINMDQTTNVPKVGIVILNWNNAPDTLECLDSVFRIDYSPFYITVVDNGSTDGSAESIQATHPELDIIRIEDNCGFCEANNIGVRHVVANGANYILLLNNDVIVDPGIIQGFLDAAAHHPDAGFLGAKTYYHAAPDTIWHGYTKWNAETCQFDHFGHRDVDDGSTYEAVVPSDFVNGCAIFFSRSLIDTIGLLDTHFFCYIDETDWCFRAMEHGFVNYYVPQAKLWHKISTSYGGVSSPEGGSNSPMKEYFRTRNMLLWARHHLPLAQRRRMWRKTLSALAGTRPWIACNGIDSLRRIRRNLHLLRHEPCCRARIEGVLDYLIRRFGDCPESTKALLGSLAIKWDRETSR
jgi:GT2 family glycosyltransferase